MDTIRCAWCGSDPLYVDYHDREWGVPVWDDTRLFEFLTLEAAQAGLSWITILRKREAYREAYFGFDPAYLATLGPEQVEIWLQNPGIVRNRLKLEASLNNARRFLEIQREFGSFAKYQWDFVGGKPLQPDRQDGSQIPAQTDLAVAYSKDLKKRGFKFLGPVVIYAHMQACGMVNDHVVSCFRHRELDQQR
jgi:DNA-3-methyladenine glycosylase I